MTRLEQETRDVHAENGHSENGRWSQQWLPAAIIAIGVALIVGPLLATLIRALLVWTGAWPHPSLSNFARLFADPRFGGAMLNTLIAGVCTTGLSVILGCGLGFLVCRTDMPGRRWLGMANMLPFFLSPYVGAIAWINLLAPHGGLLPTWMRETRGITLDWLNVSSLGGVIFVQTLFYAPYIYLFVLPPLREMDAAFEDTARVHGATFWYTLRHVTLPLLVPALIPAALIVFVSSAGLFDVAFALGVPRGISFIPTEIYAMVQNSSDLGGSNLAGGDLGRGDLGPAAAFSIVMLLVTVVLMLWQRRFLAARQFVTVTSAGYRPRPIRMWWPTKIAVLGLEAIYIGGGVLLPLAVLVMVSLSRLWAGRFHWRAANLGHFWHILTQYDVTRTAIGNSLLLAAAGATIGVAVAIPQGYYLVRGDPRHQDQVKWLLAWSPAIPGIVLGLGFLLLARQTPLYGTLSILLIACLARFLPFATRGVTAAIRATNPDLEQTARASGASWNQTIRFIVVPLLKPTLAASWLMLFVMIIRELGTTIILYAHGNETIPVTMVLLSDDNPGSVAALAVVQLILLLLAFAVSRISRAGLVPGPA
jgi:iron(III) transport system permease protein